MRTDLRRYLNKDTIFQAIVVRIGTRKSRKTGRILSTMLIRQLRDTDDCIVSDHMWIDVVPELAALHPMYGDIIEFKGTPESYIKGACSRKRYYNTGTMFIDYQLKQLHEFKVIGQVEEERREELLGWYETNIDTEEC